MTNSLRTTPAAIGQLKRRQPHGARAGKNSTLMAGAILLHIAALPIFLGKALQYLISVHRRDDRSGSD